MDFGGVRGSIDMWLDCETLVEEVRGLRRNRLCVAWLIAQRWLSWLGPQVRQLRFSLSVPFSQCGCYFVPVFDGSGESHSGRYSFDHTVNSELKLTPSTPNRRFVQVSSSPRGKQRVLLGLASGSTEPRTTSHTTRLGCFGHHVSEHGLVVPATSSV